MDKDELREIRKQKFAQMEQQLKEIHPKEESYSRSASRIDGRISGSEFGGLNG